MATTSLEDIFDAITDARKEIDLRLDDLQKHIMEERFPPTAAPVTAPEPSELSLAQAEDDAVTDLAEYRKYKLALSCLEATAEEGYGVCEPCENVATSYEEDNEGGCAARDGVCRCTTEEL